MSKQQFIWIFIVVDPDINILLGLCQFGFILTQSSLKAENYSRYKPAWSQLDMVRKYLEDLTGQFRNISHTDLLKNNQSPHNSFSFASQVEFILLFPGPRSQRKHIKL